MSGSSCEKRNKSSWNTLGDKLEQQYLPLRHNLLSQLVKLENHEIRLNSLKLLQQQNSKCRNKDHKKAPVNTKY